jgi:prepilin-type N-terminal cleavage/methylation domain-containing protein
MRNPGRGNQRGLTLIELMIVVAIIAVIAAIALTAWQDVQRKTRFSADLGTIAAIRSAVSMYYGKHNGNFPPSLAVVQSLIIPNPPMFQCSGNSYTYDPSNGMINMTVTDQSAC